MPESTPHDVQPVTVSVLIPAFNAAAFIGRAVESALAQDGIAIEVIIVDDGSTDATAEVASALARQDARVRLLTLPENKGPAEARNAGLDAARGEWVAVLDADDAYLPGRLKALLVMAGDTGADLVADNFLFYDAARGRTGLPALRPAPPVEVLSCRDFLARAKPFADEADYGLLKPMFKKDFLDRHRLRYPTHSRHGEDFLFVLEILLSGGRYALTRAPGYLYTTRNSGFSRTRVDYDAQITQTLSLLADPRIAGDGSLSELVQARAASLRHLSAQHHVNRLAASRDYPALAMLALRNRMAALEVFKRLRRRIAP